MNVKKKQSACTSDWNKLVWSSSGAKMMGPSNEKTVVLLPGHTCKAMLAVTGRLDDVNAIQKQSQAIPAEFKTQDFCKCFQQWHECWAHCVKLQGNYFEVESME